ncbi:MAG: chemotaxis response regulator protein-glutamate methylesterase [Planctomycetaceae bacterium]|nr:chemotaxis response regulator protein-glutamate methylesterase [Planctomycetaceae bacterium]
MRKIRVLVVDDSIVIRRLLSDILGADPEIELAGVAQNGRIALAKLPQINPDVVTLDIEMPELDGLRTLTELRKSYPKLPVIMFSTLTERGAVATLDALSFGASDYVTKPANVGSVAAAMQSVREQLIPKIKALFAAANPEAVRVTPRPAVVPRPPAAFVVPQRCDIVAIGSSTGGPQALTAVLRQLPAEFPIPIVIVQHMPPVFTQHLANRLNQECAIAVREATEGALVEPGKALLAPGDYHMELTRRGTSVVAHLQQGPPENSCRPAVDVLFRSAAQLYGKHCQGVVLTGMGQDGLRGAERIVDAGGSVVAQDAATSVVWGMPRAVAEAGLARQTLPLAAIAPELLRFVAWGRRSIVNSGVVKCPS